MFFIVLFLELSRGQTSRRDTEAIRREKHLSRCIQGILTEIAQREDGDYEKATGNGTVSECY